MLHLDQISVELDGAKLLEDISLDIREGDLIGIIGRSGVGKTTLLKTMAGLIAPINGEVRFNDSVLIGPTQKLVPGYEDIQLVNQDFDLDLYHTVEENIKSKMIHLDRELRTDFYEELVGLIELKEAENRQAQLLSGGEQQRLSIARALASEPKILLLDEPFVHLDQRLRLKITDYILGQHKDHKTTIVIASHDGSELLGLVESIVHLKDGRVERIDATQEVYYHPSDKQQAELMGPINEIEIESKSILFRPNEYTVSERGIELRKIRSIDFGGYVFNYFNNSAGDAFILSSLEPMADKIQIDIVKR